MDQILYGTAYYYEYLPYERLEKDIEMMREANINVVRIGESTWSTYEKADNQFDFTKLDVVLDAMYKSNIKVIVGTPTYAIPTWLAKKYPEVMVETKSGRQLYGRRQIMDITNPTFLRYAERIIRKMVSRVAQHPAVIGFQIDNETKHYGTSSENVQRGFIDYIKAKYKGDIDRFNEDFGLDYWSNRINNWEDFPSMNGTINGSLASEFEKYQRLLVNDYLEWQAGLIREYKREDQFVTHNFDFEWRGHSHGVQPDVDHFSASKCLDIVGLDVYHPSQKHLTGAEVSFAGDLIRSLKKSNYLVLETQAQAFKERVPYPGQLRQLAYSHIASGANMVEYWHWHSIHNSFETYWKGILSHDFRENPVYYEVQQVGKELKDLSKKLVNLKIKSEVAFLVSNQSLTAMSYFRFSEGKNYNDIFRLLYDEFYKLNIRTDILDEKTINLNDYKLIVVPSLYSVDDQTLIKLNDYVRNGGHVVYMFKSGFTDEHVKVRTVVQPGIISDSCGVHYDLFVDPDGGHLALNNELFKTSNTEIYDWMELLIPDTAKVLAYYGDKHWSNYAAITENNYGKGSTIYIGCYPNSSVIRDLIDYYTNKINILPVGRSQFPVISKAGENDNGEIIELIFNYSDENQEINLNMCDKILLKDEDMTIKDNSVKLGPWNVLIIERGNK
jgi:beta-galactosidase